MTRPIHYALAAVVAAASLWFIGDALGWWDHGRGSASPFRGPLASMAEAAALDQGAWVPCTALTGEQQAALTYNGNRPAESCRIESGDTTVVVLRGADSTVMSLVRVWTPAPGRLDTEYAAAGQALSREWGQSRACPENDQRGAAGDQMWNGTDLHVRLYKRLPDQLVIDYELLATLPASGGSLSSESSPPTAAPPATTKEKGNPAKNDGEIEALRKELDEIKRQLAEQDAERARSQNKSVAPK